MSNARANLLELLVCQPRVIEERVPALGLGGLGDGLVLGVQARPAFGVVLCSAESLRPSTNRLSILPVADGTSTGRGGVENQPPANLSESRRVAPARAVAAWVPSSRPIASQNFRNNRPSLIQFRRVT